MKKKEKEGKERNVATAMHSEQTSCEDEGRALGDASVKECQRLPTGHQELETGLEQGLPTVPSGNPPHQHLDLRFLTSRTMRQYIPMVSVTRAVVTAAPVNTPPLSWPTGPSSWAPHLSYGPGTENPKTFLDLSWPSPAPSPICPGPVPSIFSVS